MKCFERLVKDHITSTLDPLHKRCNRHHTALSHLDKRNIYVRMLFIDYSSAFNTILPSKLSIKLEALGLNPTLCNWVLDFLTGRPQVVKALSCTPSSPTTAWPCTPPTQSSSLQTTTVVGLITFNDETAYREEVRALGVWCQKNNLSLNANKIRRWLWTSGNSRQTDMVHQHRQCGEEGTTAPLQPLQLHPKPWHLKKIVISGKIDWLIIDLQQGIVFALKHAQGTSQQSREFSLHQLNLTEIKSMGWILNGSLFISNQFK